MTDVEQAQLQRARALRALRRAWAEEGEDLRGVRFENDDSEPICEELLSAFTRFMDADVDFVRAANAALDKASDNA